jgi:hypothetical protein
MKDEIAKQSPMPERKTAESKPVASGAPVTPRDGEAKASLADESASRHETDIARDTSETRKEATARSPVPLSRLPAVPAGVASAAKQMPQPTGEPVDGFVYPETRAAGRSGESRDDAAPRAKDGKDESAGERAWQDPDALLESLRELAKTKSTEQWADGVLRGVQALATALTGGAGEAAVVIRELIELNGQVPKLVSGIEDRGVRRKLYSANYALTRRLDVWQAVARLSNASSTDGTAAKRDRKQLAACLAHVDALIGNSPEAQGWRDYLLLDALKEEATHEDNEISPKLAQQALARMTQAPLTLKQRQFVASLPVVALRNELRRWAVEPVGVAALLRDLERYEQTDRPSDARRLALDCGHLSAASMEVRRELAQRLDAHYRNANLRVAVSEELLNRLIPERDLEYAQVNDTVLGRPVRGKSLMAAEVAVRMLPDPHRVLLALEVTGQIAAQTTGNAGPARFVNDSESYYIARKPLEVDMKGISLWPAEVDVHNETRLRDVETDLDGIPLIGSLAKGVARTQIEMSSSAATQEVRQKIAAQARQRVDAEARQRLSEVVERLNREMFDPLNSLALDPQMIDGETTEKRFTMRLRLAGEDQLGSHTPRPQAPADSLASVQIHESVINNCIQRLELDGRTFTLLALSKHIAARLNRAKLCDLSPDSEDIRITFAAKDAVMVHCRDGQVEVTVSIAELARSPERWKNFQVRAFYRPEVQARSAELKREGVVQLIGRLNMTGQIALRGVFSRAFSKNAPWQLMPERILKEPKLKDASITQFVIDDGWIGISLGPAREAVRTAARSR